MPCTDNALRNVWEAYDRTRKDISTVSRADLANVLACHREHHGAVPDGLVTHEPRRDSKLVECSRVKLFELLKFHKCGEYQKPRLRRNTRSPN